MSRCAFDDERQPLVVSNAVDLRQDVSKGAVYHSFAGHRRVLYQRRAAAAQCGAEDLQGLPQRTFEEQDSRAPFAS